MVSNEERREAAARLRKMLVHMRAREDWYFRDADTVECGNAAYRDIAKSIEAFGNMISGNYIHIVEQLADLIDRPTCKMVECTIDHGSHSWGMRCTACGKEFEHMKPSYWWHNCPNCGADVIE